MTNRTTRMLIVAAAILLVTALYALVLAGNDIDRMERSVTELERSDTTQTEVLLAQDKAIAAAYRVCLERGVCIEEASDG